MMKRGMRIQAIQETLMHQVKATVKTLEMEMDGKTGRFCTCPA